MKKLLPCSVLAALALTACPKKMPEPEKPAPKPLVVAAPPVYSGMERDAFNRAAQENFLPLFWRTDANGNGRLDPDELVILWGPFQNARRSDYVSANGFTEKFDKAWNQLKAPANDSALSPEEQKRIGLLRQELSQGKPTLVETDLSASAEDRAVWSHLSKVGELVEVLHAKQRGTHGMMEQIPAGDLVSRALFWRNQTPWCVAPKTEKEEACNAFAKSPPHVVGLYPADVQSDKAFCTALEKQPNGKALMDHFSTVVSDGKGGFKSVPYSEAYAAESEAIAKELEATAAVLGATEAAFKTYLQAAAKSFRTNDWEPANEAWVAMGPQNSKWYLRIAPDETYYEPCAWKAGYALQLARINPDSLAWQQKLEPVKEQMEQALAALAGPPYKARKVAFKLPDFIDVVLNAGDQRNPHGGTVGQSLPNWGPVAEKGGRTVAMTNLFTDLDSQAQLRGQMSSLYCAKTLSQATTDPRPATMSVVLHEASHNLGPSHDYAVKGKKDDDIFGGPLAAIMEELKAQTSALYFEGWLQTKHVITETEAKEASLRDIVWGFGHISRGMYDAEGHPRTYSQLASIQLGTAAKAGALVWMPNEKAGNGTDVGCFEVDIAKWRTMVDALAKRVLQAKGRGDNKDALLMKATFVDDKGDWAAKRAIITERWLRAPKGTFVYSVKE